MFLATKRFDPLPFQTPGVKKRKMQMVEFISPTYDPDAAGESVNCMLKRGATVRATPSGLRRTAWHQLRGTQSRHGVQASLSSCALGQHWVCHNSLLRPMERLNAAR